MSGTNETAYPQLRADIAEKGLLSLFMPTPQERRFIADAYRRATRPGAVVRERRVWGGRFN